MKISIVTISFNQARYLESAIKSVLDQDHPDVEYIVVDPGSTDGSEAIIEKYRDRIDHVVYGPDDGPADGLNKGFAKATGGIFGFLNADDLLDVNACSVIDCAFELSKADVISGHGRIIDGSGTVRGARYSHCFDPRSYVYGASVLFQQSTFFRAEVFRRVGGFNKDNRVSWDGELWFDMALAGAKFERVNRCLSSFRIYEDSITGSNKFNDLAEKELGRIAARIGIKDWQNPYMRSYERLKARILDPKLLLHRLVG